MRSVVIAVALILPLAAASGQADPDISARGSGTLPAGWSMRLDNATADPKGVAFVTMPPGWHVTTGPAAIFYRATDVARGEYVVNAVLHQTRAPMHPEAYGILLGGADLDKPTQSYLYFLVRGDGRYMVKHRQGSELHPIVEWTEHAAVAKQDASGAASNALTVRVDTDSVRFLVNARAVRAFPRTIMREVNGVAGVRINHNLDVHIGSFEVVPATKR